jgi:hypothetical protein
MQRSVTNQGSEMGVRCILAVAIPRDDLLVGVQVLILSAKKFQKFLNVHPDLMTFGQLIPLPSFRCLAFQPFSGLSLSEVHLSSTVDKVKNTPFDQVLDQIHLLAI